MRVGRRGRRRRWVRVWRYIFVLDGCWCRRVGLDAVRGSGEGGMQDWRISMSRWVSNI